MELTPCQGERMTKYTIGDISRKLNVSNDAVRYYDKEGLLPLLKEIKLVEENLQMTILAILKSLIV